MESMLRIYSCKVTFVARSEIQQKLKELMGFEFFMHYYLMGFSNAKCKYRFMEKIIPNIYKNTDILN